MKAYSLNLEAEQKEMCSDHKVKGKAYRSLKRGLRSYWKRKLLKFEDT